MPREPYDQDDPTTEWPDTDEPEPADDLTELEATAPESPPDE